MKDFAIGLTVLTFAVAFFVLSGFGLLWTWANFRLWRADLTAQAMVIEQEGRGKAALAEATFSKQARVESARAEQEAAQLTADAIAIVGEAAQQYPEYRQQEFYLALGEALKEGEITQILYLPTEAGMPITEAGKRPAVVE